MCRLLPIHPADQDQFPIAPHPFAVCSIGAKRIAAVGVGVREGSSR
ncbi:MAG: hypothetical protein HS103_18755 [Anaerolineales bacterium]|nr:hypothetical protein [Anaerolineales bacterium]